MARELISHKVTGLNEKISIDVVDDPGPGGACHEYRMSIDTSKTIERVYLSFQNGPIQEVGVNGVSIEARGTDDAHLELDDYSLVAGAPTKKADIAIGVTHAPYERVLAAMAVDKLDLIFAGHTHGGQVRLPWFGESKALTTNCDLETWRSRGVSRVNDEPWLNVSAGMGTSPFARIRVASPPEVSLITLTA